MESISELRGVILAIEEKDMYKLYFIGLVTVIFGVLLSNIVFSFEQTVYDVQRALQAQGYSPGATDGVIGPDTKASIAKFQKDHGLPITGKIDRNLINSLGLVKNEKSSVPKYPDGDKNILKTADGRFQMKLATKWVGIPDNPDMVHLPGIGQAAVVGGWLISAGQVSQISDGRITLKFFKKTEEFSIKNTTTVCTEGGSVRPFGIYTGDSVAVFSKLDSMDATTIYIGQFYILMNPDNVAEIEIEIEKFSCNVVTQ